MLVTLERGNGRGTNASDNTSDANKGVANATIVNLITLDSTVTDASGDYSFSDKLSIGTHSFSISATDFTSSNTSLAISGGLNEKNLELLKPVHTTNRIAIILTWSSAPKDLDSHLYVPKTSSSTFEIKYDSTHDNTSETTKEYASLDVDDTSGDGPETTTIKFENNEAPYSPRNYRYFVHNFSNDASFDGNMKVRVLINGTHQKTYTGKTGQNGRYWHVFDMGSDGTITDVDTYGSEPEKIYE